ASLRLHTHTPRLGFARHEEGPSPSPSFPLQPPPPLVLRRPGRGARQADEPGGGARVQRRSRDGRRQRGCVGLLFASLISGMVAADCSLCDPNRDEPSCSPQHSTATPSVICTSCPLTSLSSKIQRWLLISRRTNLIRSTPFQYMAISYQRITSTLICLIMIPGGGSSEENLEPLAIGLFDLLARNPFSDSFKPAATPIPDQ
ncbi:unnamed protein product, partial [Urochloa humidicola]